MDPFGLIGGLLNLIPRRTPEERLKRQEAKAYRKMMRLEAKLSRKASKRRARAERRRSRK